MVGTVRPGCGGHREPGRGREFANRSDSNPNTRRPRAQDRNVAHCLPLARHYQLPYGWWTCSDGTVVLFDRQYQPIAERLPSGEVRLTDQRPCRISQQWFHKADPSLRNRNDPDVSARLYDILCEWGVS